MLGAGAEVATLDDALGLAPDALRRPWPAPRKHRVTIDTPAARAAVESLAALVLANAKTEVEGPDGERRLLLEGGYGFHGPGAWRSAGAAEVRVPLEEVWKGWLADRPAETRDADGLELFRVLLADDESAVWRGPNAKKVTGGATWSTGRWFLRAMLEWCACWQAPAGAAAFLADGVEDALAALTPAELDALAAQEKQGLTGLMHEVRSARTAARVDTARTWLQRLRARSGAELRLPGVVVAVTALAAWCLESVVMWQAAAWSDITPLARNEFICWVEDAKQPATRQRRIQRRQSLHLAALRDHEGVRMAGVRVAQPAHLGHPVGPLDPGQLARDVVRQRQIPFGIERRPVHGAVLRVPSRSARRTDALRRRAWRPGRG